MLPLQWVDSCTKWIKPKVSISALLRESNAVFKWILKSQWRIAEGLWVPKEEENSMLSPSSSRCIAKNSYIDMAVQKCEILGMPGCLEHTGMVMQLMRQERTDCPSESVMAQPGECSQLHSTQACAVQDIMSLAKSETSLHDDRDWHYHRVYQLCDPVLPGHKHVCKVCWTWVQRAQKEIYSMPTTHQGIHW